MKRTFLFLAMLLLAALSGGCASDSNMHILGPNEVAWKPGTSDTQIKGQVDVREWMIDTYLSVPTGQVAVGQKGEVKGPGEYRDIPKQGWSPEAAFQIDGPVVGVVRKPDGKDPAFDLLEDPGYYPYRKVDVRTFPVGPVQIRTQTTDAYADGTTGVKVCLEDPTNDVCDGSITGLILKADDPEIKGMLDFDVVVQFDLTEASAAKLWQMGDWKQYLKKILINKVRGMRSMTAGYTPDEFVHSTKVETELIGVLTGVFTQAVAADPIKIVDVRIRRREVSQTPMQLAAAEQAKALQAIENDQARIEQEKQLDLAKIESQKAVDRANEEAVAARNEFLREQAKLNEQAGLKYIPCVEQLRDLNLTADQMAVAIIGCMDSETVSTMNRQLQPAWPQP